VPVDNLPERGRSRHPSDHNEGFRLPELLGATMVLAVTLALAFPEVLFGGKTLQSGGNVAGVLGVDPPYGYEGRVPPDNFRLDRGASAWLVEPGLHNIRRSYGDVDAPLWNPNVGTGAPLLANMQSAPFNPLKLPPLISPSPGMWDLYLLGRFLLGGIVALLFARVLGMALPGALVVAVGYILSGHFMLYSNNHWLEVYLVLPLILCGVEVIVRSARPWGAALLAAAVALNLLAGMPEPSLLALSFAGGYAAYRLALSTTEARNVGFGLRRAALLSAGFIGGFALAAPNLLPFAEYVANSYNLHTAERQIGLGFDSPRLAISLLVPFFNGTPWDNSQHTGWSGVRNWVGVVLPFLAVVGLGHRSLMKQAGWWFLGAALLALTKTYGVPGINELGRLPLANITIFVTWIAPVAAFSVALLAGIGVDRIYRGEASTFSLHFAGVVIVGVLTLLLLYNWDTLSDLGSREILWLSLSFALVIGVWGLIFLGRWFTGSWSVHAAAIVAVGALLYLIVDHWGSPGAEWPIRVAIGFGLVVVLWVLLGRGSRLAGHRFAWVCLALVAFELLLFSPHGIYRDRHDTFSKPPYVEFLEHQQSTEGSARVFAFDALLFPNIAGAYDLHDIRALDALYPERYIPYLHASVSPDIFDRFVGGPYASDEGLAHVADNPLFDLTGVEYIVTGPQGVARVLPNPIIDKAVSEAGSSPLINRTGFNLDGVEKPVLFAHPPSDVTFQITPTNQAHNLEFSLALDPASWSGPGDGVIFEVALASSPAETTVFRRTVDPKSNAADRRWLDESLDLSTYIGQELTVHFRTLMGTDSLADWSGWGDPRLTGETEPEGGPGQFQLVYDGEARIYRNAHAFPRAFAVHDVRTVVDGDAALALMLEDDFDPSRMAVVERSVPSLLPAAGASADPPNDSEVRITKYRDSRVELSASMDAAGLVLLTDTYYPGWNAYVDGEKTELYEADYLFRGVAVPEGEHQIELVYDPASFKLGAILGLSALVCMLAMVAIDLYRHRAGSVDGTGDESPAESRRLM